MKTEEKLNKSLKIIDILILKHRFDEYTSLILICFDELSIERYGKHEEFHGIICPE